jgi:membrane associated rhomboid family serine protease
VIAIGDNIPRQNPPITTWLLILANCVIFLFELGVPQPELIRFFALFGVVPARFMHADWASSVGFPVATYWPFLTSMFLHGGWFHIIGNMWALWIFGDNVEDRMGPLRFLIFYLLSGLASGIVHCLTNPDSVVPTVGASGAIAGVMGAYFFLFPNARVIVLFPVLFIPFFFELPAVVYLGFWALSQVFIGTLSLAHAGDVTGVAWWAHTGGFVTGMVLQFFFVRRGRAYRPLSRDEYGMEVAWVPYPYWRAYR